MKTILELRSKFVKDGTLLVYYFKGLKVALSMKDASYLNKPSLYVNDTKIDLTNLDNKWKLERIMTKLAPNTRRDAIYFMFLDAKMYPITNIKNENKMKDSGKANEAGELLFSANRRLVDENEKCVIEIKKGLITITRNPADIEEGDFTNEHLQTLKQIRDAAIKEKISLSCKLKGVNEEITLFNQVSFDLMWPKEAGCIGTRNRGMASYLMGKRNAYSIPEEIFKQMIYLSATQGFFMELDRNTDLNVIEDKRILSPNAKEKHIQAVLKNYLNQKDEVEKIRLKGVLDNLGYVEPKKRIDGGRDADGKEKAQSPIKYAETSEKDSRHNGKKKRKPWGKNIKNRQKKATIHAANIVISKEKTNLERKRFNELCSKGETIVLKMQPKDSCHYSAPEVLEKPKKTIKGGKNKPIMKKLRMPVPQKLSSVRKTALPYQAKWRNYECNRMTISYAMAIITDKCNIPASITDEELMKAIINGEHNNTLSQEMCVEIDKMSWGKNTTEHQLLKRDIKQPKNVAKLVCVRDEKTAIVHRLPSNDADKLLLEKSRFKIVGKSVWKAARTIGKAEYGLVTITGTQYYNLHKVAKREEAEKLRIKIEGLEKRQASCLGGNKEILKIKRKISRLSARLYLIESNEKVSEKADKKKVERKPRKKGKTINLIPKSKKAA